ncbi:MAG: hypothetical protein A2Y17_00775 [Clostridiales bacterium GWF2_38_85]|nr:MAG: hypothetical protein A2Y17_00775 [Clostridiales bacterium GWF2_38_85]
MQNQEILNYVDNVVSKVDIPDEYKTRLENELIRNIMKAMECSNIDEIKNYLCSSEELANKLALKLSDNKIKDTQLNNSYKEYDNMYTHHHPHKYNGEYMREHSEFNLKLLYIPLLQLTSGTERISMPLTDDC